MAELNNDTDHSERARALHRVVRAMHDGECPKCHALHSSADMTRYIYAGGGHRCPTCAFTITAAESEAALEEFAGFMDKNLAVFEEWRASRTK